MKFVVAAAVVTTLAIAAPARAQPGNYALQPAPARQVDTVDENVALGLSLGGTAASWALLIAGAEAENGGLATIGLAGTIFAPSFGHWYAHDGLTRGLGMRLVGMAAGVVAVSIAIGDAFDEQNNSDDTTAGGLLLVGAGLYIAGTVDDIATASSAARKYNSRFQDITLAPTANPHGGGFALLGRF